MVYPHKPIDPIQLYTVPGQKHQPTTSSEDKQTRDNHYGI